MDSQLPRLPVFAEDFRRNKDALAGIRLSRSTTADGSIQDMSRSPEQGSSQAGGSNQGRGTWNGNGDGKWATPSPGASPKGPGNGGEVSSTTFEFPRTPTGRLRNLPALGDASFSGSPSGRYAPSTPMGRRLTPLNLQDTPTSSPPTPGTPDQPDMVGSPKASLSPTTVPRKRSSRHLGRSALSPAPLSASWDGLVNVGGNWNEVGLMSLGSPGSPLSPSSGSRSLWGKGEGQGRDGTDRADKASPSWLKTGSRLGPGDDGSQGPSIDVRAANWQAGTGKGVNHSIGSPSVDAGRGFGKRPAPPRILVPDGESEVDPGHDMAVNSGIPAAGVGISGSGRVATKGPGGVYLEGSGTPEDGGADQTTGPWEKRKPEWLSQVSSAIMSDATVSSPYVTGIRGAARFPTPGSPGEPGTATDGPTAQLVESEAAGESLQLRGSPKAGRRAITPAALKESLVGLMSPSTRAKDSRGNNTILRNSVESKVSTSPPAARDSLETKPRSSARFTDSSEGKQWGSTGSHKEQQDSGVDNRPPQRVAPADAVAGVGGRVGVASGAILSSNLGSTLPSGAGMGLGSAPGAGPRSGLGVDAVTTGTGISSSGLSGVEAAGVKDPLKGADLSMPSVKMLLASSQEAEPQPSLPLPDFTGGPTPVAERNHEAALEEYEAASQMGLAAGASSAHPLKKAFNRLATFSYGQKQAARMATFIYSNSPLPEGGSLDGKAGRPEPGDITSPYRASPSGASGAAVGAAAGSGISSLSQPVVGHVEPEGWEDPTQWPSKGDADVSLVSTSSGQSFSTRSSGITSSTTVTSLGSIAQGSGLRASGERQKALGLSAAVVVGSESADPAKYSVANNRSGATGRPSRDSQQQQIRPQQTQPDVGGDGHSGRAPRATDAGEDEVEQAAPVHGLPTDREWTWSDFKVKREVGVGRYSTVYQAEVRHNVFPVALKLYHRKKMDSYVENQVRREIRIHSRLHHKCISQLYGFFEDREANICLVLEWAPLGDVFEDRRKGKGPLSEERAVREVIQPMLFALYHLHKDGIIHRDIKPENILLFPERRIKLADFGFAIDINEQRPCTRLGTTDYMAPEIINCTEDTRNREHGNYDAAVDAWAMGVLAYELLTGRPPFQANSRKETYSLIKKGEVTLPRHLSTEASSFIISALLRNPQQRPTVKQLLKHPWIVMHGRPMKHRRSHSHSPKRQRDDALSAAASRIQPTEPHHSKDLRPVNPRPIICDSPAGSPKAQDQAAEPTSPSSNAATGRKLGLGATAMLRAKTMVKPATPSSGSSTTFLGSSAISSPPKKMESSLSRLVSKLTSGL